jgi:hypothetical protein
MPPKLMHMLPLARRCGRNGNSCINSGYSVQAAPVPTDLASAQFGYCLCVFTNKPRHQCYPRHLVWHSRRNSSRLGRRLLVDLSLAHSAKLHQDITPLKHIRVQLRRGAAQTWLAVRRPARQQAGRSLLSCDTRGVSAQNKFLRHYLVSLYKTASTLALCECASRVLIRWQPHYMATLN